MFLVEAGFHHVGQAGLELLTSGDPPTLVSQNAGIRGKSHRTWPIQLLKENIGLNLHDLEFDSEFLAITPKAKTPKEKIDNLDHIKIETLLGRGSLKNQNLVGGDEGKKI